MNQGVAGIKIRWLSRLGLRVGLGQVRQAGVVGAGQAELTLRTTGLASSQDLGDLDQAAGSQASLHVLAESQLTDSGVLGDQGGHGESASRELHRLSGTTNGTSGSSSSIHCVFFRFTCLRFNFYPVWLPVVCYYTKYSITYSMSNSFSIIFQIVLVECTNKKPGPSLGR